MSKLESQMSPNVSDITHFSKVQLKLLAGSRNLGKSTDFVELIDSIPFLNVESIPFHLPKTKPLPDRWQWLKKLALKSWRLIGRKKKHPLLTSFLFAECSPSLLVKLRLESALVNTYISIPLKKIRVGFKMRAEAVKLCRFVICCGSRQRVRLT